MICRPGTPARLKTNRFQLTISPMSGSPGLTVLDYMYWIENEREILNWMNETLSQGIDHVEGMTIRFDNDFDRINFLMKWGP